VPEPAAGSQRATRYTPPPRDWTGDDQAQHNRKAKAEKIIQWCWDNSVEPDLDDISPRRRGQIARQLGYSRVSDQTWSLVVAGFRQRRDQEWREGNLPGSSP
jgi:hypothetical protein